MAVNLTPRRLAIRTTFAASTLLLGATLASAEPQPSSATQPSSAPRLILPGDRPVQAGQLIHLRWTKADSISELEILLSLDGSRHFSICISPQLDPDRCAFLWRVPDLGRAVIRFRIRFNRGGREIEGAPTEAIRLVANGGDWPEPL